MLADLRLAQATISALLAALALLLAPCRRVAAVVAGPATTMSTSAVATGGRVRPSAAALVAVALPAIALAARLVAMRLRLSLVVSAVATRLATGAVAAVALATLLGRVVRKVRAVPALAVPVVSSWPS